MAERFADAEHVRDVLSRPQLADPPEPCIDGVDDEQCAGIVTPRAEPVQEVLRRNARACTSLHRLDDHAGRIARENTRILAERPPVHGAGKPPRERRTEALEAACGYRQQSRAVVRAVEGQDPW